MENVEHKVAGFFAKYPERQFARHQIMVHAGDDPPGVFYLTSGRVSQYDISNSGTEVVVNNFKPPAFFPMSWAINRTPNQYFFEADTEVVARLASADEVVSFLRQEPAVLFDLLSRVYKGTDGLLRKLAHSMGGDARSRLMFELVIAAYRFGKQNEDGSVQLALKEGDLAKHSGLARETVNRLIQGLKNENIVEVNKSGMLIRDVASLETLLGPDL